MNNETCRCGRPLIARPGELADTCAECRHIPNACSCPPLDPQPSGDPLPSLLSRILPGGCILDVPAIPAAVWGRGEEILWAKGQSLILAGPDGVGKTTVAGNIIEARLGLGPAAVLGLPVCPGERNVLVLLMDRPQQSMASLARFFTEADRGVLDARLRVWRGPPPQDLARNTRMLAELCLLADADTCVVDSLKDAALKLSEDETGSGWNQARQIAIEAGTQLLELHHPRKSQEGNKKPSKLEDLYGSRWIPAGAGSVLSLWGEAGDPVVELTHLKPVVTTLGPWHVTLDGKTGRVTAEHDTDLIEQTRLQGAAGMTVTIAAQLLGGAGKPSRSDVEKARRRLRKLTEAGLLHERAEGTGRGATSVWYLAEHAGNPRSGSHAESHAPLPGLEVTHPSTPVHANSETPGQKVTTEITDPHAHATGEKSRQGGVTYIPPGVTSPGGGWPGPKPPCRHPACWDALAGECLARRGLCLTCGGTLDPKLAASGDTTHPNCGEEAA